MISVSVDGINSFLSSLNQDEEMISHRLNSYIRGAEDKKRELESLASSVSAVNSQLDTKLTAICHELANINSNRDAEIAALKSSGQFTIQYTTIENGVLVYHTREDEDGLFKACEKIRQVYEQRRNYLESVRNQIYSLRDQVSSMVSRIESQIPEIDNLIKAAQNAAERAYREMKKIKNKCEEAKKCVKDYNRAYNIPKTKKSFVRRIVRHG